MANIVNTYLPMRKDSTFPITLKSPLNLTLLAILLIALALHILLFINPSTVFSAADHIVISEIQVEGAGSTTDEFIELFNPTASTVDISDWRLERKTAGGGTLEDLVSSMSGSIAANSYYLVAHDTNYDAGVAPDATYSANVTGANTVTLYDNGAAVIDKVGMGTAGDYEGAGAASSPPDDRSIRRIGNDDSDNNATDFELTTVSDPQNSAVSESPMPTPSDSPTPAPTDSPSPSASPTMEPTQTPTASPSPTPALVNLSAILSGDQEVPSVSTSAIGQAEMTFDLLANTFDLNIDVDGIALGDLTGSHIHLGATGVNGGIIVDLGPVGEWFEGASILREIVNQDFPAENAPDLLAGNTYINIHTTAHEGGEIRGQLAVVVPPTPTPTPSPSPEPTETPTPSPTPEPTQTPSPTPFSRVIGRFVFPGRQIECRLVYRQVRIGFIRVFFPRIICQRA